MGVLRGQMNEAQRQAVDKMVITFLEQDWEVELIIRKHGYVKITATEINREGEQ